MPPFESSVDSYGSQTKMLDFHPHAKFESSVDSYGSQTLIRSMNRVAGLRVV